MNHRFRTATHRQERVQSCPEGEGVGQHGGLAALVHLRAPSEVPELPLHILGSGVLLELERLEEGDRRAEVREVAALERAQRVGVRKREMNVTVERSCGGFACRATTPRLQMAMHVHMQMHMHMQAGAQCV